MHKFYLCVSYVALKSFFFFIFCSTKLEHKFPGMLPECVQNQALTGRYTTSELSDIRESLPRLLKVAASPQAKLPPWAMSDLKLFCFFNVTPFCPTEGST